LRGFQIFFGWIGFRFGHEFGFSPKKNNGRFPSLSRSNLLWDSLDGNRIKW
jgi:hypothetical protein